MEAKKLVCRCGMALGFAQAALCSGCVGDSGSDSLFSNSSNAQAGETMPGGASRLDFIPVRISRGFFDSQLSGSVDLHLMGQNQVKTFDSSVAWKVLPSEQPAPTGNYQADFRDQPGCATFEQLGGAEVCFTLSGDVSSVDLTSKKIQTHGLEKLIGQKLSEGSCATTVQNLKFVEAKKAQKTVSILFRADANRSADCGSSGPVEVQMTLRQL